MKLHLLHLSALLALGATSLMAVPVQIAQESFEGTLGSIGFTTSVPQFIETGPTFNAQSDYFSMHGQNDAANFVQAAAGARAAFAPLMGQALVLNFPNMNVWLRQIEDPV